MPTTAPEDIASFAQRVGEQWKIGRKDVGDGLILVVAKNDRAVQIQVAKALQGAVPDIAAGRIISQQNVPAFRAGDYAGGLNTAVDRLGERIAGEALPAPTPTTAQNGARRDSRGGGFDFQSIAIFLHRHPFLGSILSRVMGKKLGALATGAVVGGLGWLMTTSLLIGLGIAVMALFMVGVMGARWGAAVSARSSGAAVAASVAAVVTSAAVAAAAASPAAAAATSTAAAPRGGGDGALAGAALRAPVGRRPQGPAFPAGRGAGADRGPGRRQQRSHSNSACLRTCRSACRRWRIRARHVDTAHPLLLAERAIELVADRGLSQQVDAAEWQRIMASLLRRHSTSSAPRAHSWSCR